MQYLCTINVNDERSISLLACIQHIPPKRANVIEIAIKVQIFNRRSRCKDSQYMLYDECSLTRMSTFNSYRFYVGTVHTRPSAKLCKFLIPSDVVPIKKKLKKKSRLLIEFIFSCQMKNIETDGTKKLKIRIHHRLLLESIHWLLLESIHSTRQEISVLLVLMSV